MRKKPGYEAGGNRRCWWEVWSWNESFPAKIPAQDGLPVGPEQSLGAEDLCIPSPRQSFPAHNRVSAAVLGPRSARRDCSGDFCISGHFCNDRSCLWLFFLYGEFLAEINSLNPDVAWIHIFFFFF